MGLLEQLQEQGWYITEPGLAKLLETGGEKNGPLTNPDVKQVVKIALNTDLKEFGGGALASLATRGTKVECFDGSGVVQLVKLRNLGAPKVNEESKVAPRLLKLTITDGQTQYVALEHEHIPALSLNTPPGTKLLLKNGPIRIAAGVLMLSDKNITVLGGHVTALVEKWELSRTMAKYAKGGRLQFSTTGPPPWIPFGQKIQQLPAGVNDKDFKSLQTKEKEESKENSEFNAQRNDAIAEATKLGTKKTFGGGSKQMVDANVQKIMDKGFTEEQANHALKLTRNNVQRALSNLQRIEDRKQQHAASQSDGDYGGGGAGGKFDSGYKAGGGRRGAGKREAAELELLAKPTGKVSLSDFLGDILTDSEPPAPGGTSVSGGSKKSSKESTPNDSHRAGGRGTESNSRAETNHRGGNRNNRQESSQNRQTANGGTVTTGGNRNANLDANMHTNHAGSGSGSAAGSKQHHNQQQQQQRFENNISSSFANRNTSSAPSNASSSNNPRGNQQQTGHYGGGPQSNQKQSDYHGSGGGRYRGGNDPASSSIGNHNSGSSNTGGHGGPVAGGSSRGGDSKYTQQHSSATSGRYSSAQHRQDNYNNNTNNSNSNGNGTGNAGSGGKYGKGQSTNASAGYNNNYAGPDGASGRNHHGQSPHAQETQQGHRGGKGGANATATSHYGSAKQSNHPPQQQQQAGSALPSDASGNNLSTAAGFHGPNATQKSDGSGNNNNTNKSSNRDKSGRYGGKDESHRYGGGPGSGSAPAAVNSTKKGTSRSNSSTQPQSAHGGGPAPFGGNKQQQQHQQHTNSKVNQLTDDVTNLAISSSKSSVPFSTSNSNSGPPGSSGPNKSANAPQKSLAGAHPPGSMVPHGPPPIAASPVTSTAASVALPIPGPGITPPGIPTVAGGGGGGGGGAGLPKGFIHLPNGYNYNPYQIVGFQNKQSNEFALNVLKSQQQQHHQQQQPHHHQQHPQHPQPQQSPFDPMQQQHLAAPPVAPGAVSPVLPAVPLGAAGGPVAAGAGVLPAAILQPTAPTGPPVGPPMAPMTVAPAAAMAPMHTNWKIGDHCMAKYWEDGGYYTAEITNTSKNTFVVHFLEYGNYEEVLKTDCIPIAQAPPAPVTAAPMALGYHAAPAPHMAPALPQPAPVPGPPMQYAPPPPQPPHPHHHGHAAAPPPPLTTHHAPPMAAAGGPGAFAGAPLQDSRQMAYTMGHHPPPNASPAPQPPIPMAPATPTPMNQYQPNPQHHIHHPQQQQQQQTQSHPQHQQNMHHHSQQHMSQHHHQAQMVGGHGGGHQQHQQRGGTKFREQRPMYVPPAQRK
uniref:Tudor domain-containing protein 3 n=1 Tax=Anopheles triannulatus TaxID=58253 RepID=A0A2M4AA52_9DIPT